MSHPFTSEYMQEGETSSKPIGRDVAKQKTNQEVSESHASRIKSRASTSRPICERNPNTDNYEADAYGTCGGSMVEIKEEMSITIPDNERMSFLTIAQMAMGRRIEMFAQEVSIVGLSYLVKKSSNQFGSIIRKIMWTLLLLFGTAFMVFQIYDRVSFYLTYPTNVNYRVTYNRSLRFPTVTICPECLVSKEKFSSLVPGSRELVDICYPPFWDLEFGERFQALTLSNLDLDWELFGNYVTVKVEDMILECSFGNLPCNSSEAFKRITSGSQFCVSFNPVTANYVTTNPGAINGLRLVLWVNQSDCAVEWTPAVGFRVALHDPRDQPLIQAVGFRVGTGISTSVSFSLRNLSMLPSPYGDCRPNENYSFMQCCTQCMADYMIYECKCRPLHFEGAEKVKVCSLDKYYYCLAKVVKYGIHSDVLRQCYCPLQCYLPSYPFSVSTSPLSQHFLNHVSQRSQFKGRNLTMAQLRNGLVYLDIFYSDLNYVDIQTTPAYDILALVCDCSGALGLILGGTLLTIAEIVQFFVELFSELVTSARFARMERR